MQKNEWKIGKHAQILLHMENVTDRLKNCVFPKQKTGLN